MIVVCAGAVKGCSKGQGQPQEADQQQQAPAAGVPITQEPGRYGLIRPEAMLQAPLGFSENAWACHSKIALAPAVQMKDTGSWPTEAPKWLQARELCACLHQQSKIEAVILRCSCCCTGDGFQAEGSLRRSTRRSIKPLDWWRNEKAIYERKFKSACFPCLCSGILSIPVLHLCVNLTAFANRRQPTWGIWVGYQMLRQASVQQRQFCSSPRSSQMLNASSTDLTQRLISMLLPCRLANCGRL